MAIIRESKENKFRVSGMNLGYLNKKSKNIATLIVAYTLLLAVKGYYTKKWNLSIKTNST